MNKKAILLLFLLILSIYTLNINVQITAEENNNRPTSIELTPHDPISITSDSDFEVFPGTGTAEDPYVIEGYNITTTDDLGISITDTTKYFVIRNCYVNAEEYGININNVVDGSVTVINNTCSNNSIGIYLRGFSPWLSYSSTVINNTCSNNNRYGIYLSNSGRSTVVNNTCNDNYSGILLDYSSSSAVVNNTCSNNKMNGIYLCNSDFCVITYNLLQENDKYGVYLSNSDDNTIHHNTFVDNNLGGTSQACDGGHRNSNTWYDTVTQEGNYWSDWNGTGSYSIDSSTSSEDPYPLTESTTVEIQIFFTFTLLMLVVPLLLSKIISKKSKKHGPQQSFFLFFSFIFLTLYYFRRLFLFKKYV